jgi:uncharacterized protein (TIGR02118 family)
MARMVVIYKTPQDPAAFDEHYFGVHVPMAKRLPGLRKFEVSHGPIATPAGGPPFHMVAMLQFDSLAAIKQAFATPEGRACAADRRVLAPRDEDLIMVLFDDREV